MKNFLVLFALILIVTACEKDQNIQTERDYTISILPVGEICASYSPLTKSESEQNVWYGINIKRDGENYQMGVYDDISKFKVQLSSSHNYSFEITAVRGSADGFVRFNEDFNIVAGFMRPFDLGITGFYDGTRYTWAKLSCDDSGPASRWAGYKNEEDVINKLQHYFCFAKKAFQKQEIKWENYIYSLPYLSSGSNSNEWYRFYGTKTNYTPTQDEKIPFTMKHEGFGLQYSVSGICDGSVSVVIDNALTGDDLVTYFSQPSITGNYTSAQRVIEFRDMTAETEQVKVTVVWTRGNNVIDNLGSTTVNVRRNKVNKINITLGEHSAEKSMAVTTDASDYFGNEDKTITI